MTKILVPFPVFRAFDEEGLPLVGGKLYTYAAGTLTPLATFVDESGGTENVNPVILDSTGSANVWLGTAPYKFVLKDANDIVQWTVDYIGAKPPTIVNVVDYGAVGDGTTDDQPAFAAAASAAGSWGTVVVPRPAVSYKLGSNVSASVFWLLMGSATTSGSGVLGGLTIAQLDGGSINIGGTAFEITNTGQVGVGTNAPAELLDVAGNINFPNVSGNPNGKLMWNDGDATIDFNVTANNLMTFNINGSIYSFGGGLTMPTSGATGSPVTWNAVVGSDTFTSTVDPSGAYFQGLAPKVTLQAAKTGGGGDDFSMVHNGSTTAAQLYLAYNYHTGSFNSGGAAYPMVTINGLTDIVLGGYLAGSINSSNAPQATTLIVGTASTRDVMQVYDKSSGSTSQTAIKFLRGGTNTGNATTVGSITTTNSATAFNTSSDYRLKEIIGPVHNALREVNKLPAYLFKWKANGETADGFMAHEVQDIAPYAVQGVKDGDEMQQLDYSKLVPLLWAAVQELSAKVKALEAKSV